VRLGVVVPPRSVGQIAEASLTFGDLTTLVGPQATGKSIALQLLKLMVDAGQVQEEEMDLRRLVALRTSPVRGQSCRGDNVYEP
jgi:ABC-type transport system involved in cytochrome bd biosynthesis fused ATPase/permease subunit